MDQKKTPENRLYSPFRKLVTGNLSIQLMVTVMAAVTYAVIAYFWNPEMGALITSVVFIPAYISMLYTFYWGVAERERNMVKFGHMEADPGRGLKAGLLAAIPIGAYALLAMVLAYLGEGSDLIGFFRICAAPFLVFVNPAIEYAPFALILTAIFSPLAALWGYHNGSKLYRAWDHLIYKNGVKKRRGAKEREELTRRSR